MDEMLTQFWEWVNERHAIYIRKSLREGVMVEDLYVPEGCELEEADPDMLATAEPGQPLTDDPVMMEYRFCNVFRELDRVTVWVEENIRQPFKHSQHLWFMLAAARYINWPDTLAELITYSEKHNVPCWPSHEKFKPSDMTWLLQQRKEAGKKVYTGAYMIRAESNPKADWYKWTKQRYVSEIVLGRLWDDRLMWEELLAEPGLTVERVWREFQQPRYIGWGPFMAYQVCVDMRHTHYLDEAPDINTWAALGPGSRRGLNRLHGRSPDFNLTQLQGLEEMQALMITQRAHRAPWVPFIELSDIQNCLCEFDKWQRVRRDEGRPRAKYTPGRGY